MNFDPSAVFSVNAPDIEAIELKEVRKEMAFDFCFKAIYPDTSEDNMRECVHAYKRYTRLVQGVFAEVIRDRQRKTKK